ncbi:MAG: hypothetical protein AB7T38_02670 [Nitrospirales bacterium]
MAKEKSRTEMEFEKGKKSLYAWIEASNKDWLEAEKTRQRRSLAATLDTLLEEVRARRAKDRPAVLEEVAS